MSNFKNKPLVFTAAVLFLIVYTFYSLSFFISVSDEDFDIFHKRKLQNIATMIQTSQLLLDKKLYSELKPQLENAVNQRLFDFYIIMKDGKPESSKLPEGSSDILTWDWKVNTFVNGVNNSYMSIKDDQYQIVLGTNNSRAQFQKARLKENRNLLLKDIAIVLVLMAGIVFYFMKDITTILDHFFGDKKVDRDLQLSPKTHEAMLLHKGIANFRESVSELNERVDLIEHQVLPALKKEIFSNKTPPYQFDAVVVRTDINNFSTIYNSHPVEPFMQTVQEFFLKSSIAIQRYKGLVSEYIGDEIIFYFKDEEHDNSFASALSAIRDLGKVASEIDKLIFEKHGYHFTIKSAISHSNLRFGKLVDHLTISGPSLIESVRLLSVIEEKDANTVIFPERLEKLLPPWCQAEFYGQFKLKGYADEVNLLKVVSTQSVENLMDKMPKGDWVQFFKNDSDLIFLFQSLKTQWSSTEKETLLKFLNIMSNFDSVLVSKPLVEEFVSLFKYAVDYAKTNDDKNFALASLIAMLGKIFNQKDFDAYLSEVLFQCFEINEPRIHANAIDVLIRFNSMSTLDDFESDLLSTNNRVLANSLVLKGQKELSTAVKSGIEKMVESDDDAFVASGLYAIGELAVFYKKQNKTFYQTNKFFAWGKEQCNKGVSALDERVKRQSQIALKKM